MPARPRGAADEAGPLVLRYIETSALLSALLEGDEEARAAIGGGGRRVTSALTFAEASRALVRARTAGRLTIEQERAALALLVRLERSLDLVEVTAQVLVRAGRPFPVEPVRTLDAIHLSTLELLSEAPQMVTVVTRDARVRDNARALGCAVE